MTATRVRPAELMQHGRYGRCSGNAGRRRVGKHTGTFPAVTFPARARARPSLGLPVVQSLCRARGRCLLRRCSGGEREDTGWLLASRWCQASGPRRSSPSWWCCNLKLGAARGTGLQLEANTTHSNTTTEK